MHIHPYINQYYIDIRMWKKVVIGLLLILASFYILLNPPYADTLTFKGQEIRIQRGPEGIPHIHAQSRSGYLYALGYVTAEDRLFQICFRRTFAQGRIAEFLGERALPSDIMMREVGFNILAKDIANRLKKEDPASYKEMSAYIEGINSQGQNRLIVPLQFWLTGMRLQKWEVSDLYLIYKLIDWSTTFSLFDETINGLLSKTLTQNEIQELLPSNKDTWAFDSKNIVKENELKDKYKNSKYKTSGKFLQFKASKIKDLGIPEFYPMGEGSNAWVISGNHTASGKPLLVGDPHLDNSLPTTWYQFKASYTNNNGYKVRFAGVSLTGTPVCYGKSDYLSIGVTTIYTDTQDLYKQKLKDDYYFVDNLWRDLGKREEVILVKKDSGIQKVKHQVRMTHRGPILSYVVSGLGIFDLTGENLSLAWSGYTHGYKSLLAMSKLHQSSTFQEAVQHSVEGATEAQSLSILSATADNHICYQQVGNNPIRSSYEMGAIIKDGTTSEHDWKGMMPPKDKIMVCDPERGYFVAANNQAAPDVAHGGYFKHTIFTARADRLQKLISDEIKSGKKITPQFANKLLYDTTDSYCQRIIPQIIKIVEQSKKTHSNFDCDFKSTSFKATMYQIFMFQLWTLTKPNYNFNASVYSNHKIHQYVFNYIHKAYKGDQKKQEIMKKAWKGMKVRLAEFYKTKDQQQWKWGQYHRDTMNHIPFGFHPVLKHIFNRQTDGWGNLHTPNVGKANKMELGNFATSHRANFRHVFDFGGPSWWIVDGGVSENILSRHYSDQWHKFIEGKLIPIDSNDSLQDL